jgi:hypothetical protein
MDHNYDTKLIKYWQIGKQRHRRILHKFFVQFYQRKINDFKYYKTNISKIL